MSRIIQVQAALNDQECAALKGKYLNFRHFDQIVSGETTDVLKPDGSPLLLLRPSAISAAACKRARPALQRAGTSYSEHRQLHSGLMGYYEKPDCRTVEFTAEEIGSYAQCLPFVRECNRVFRKQLPARYIPQRMISYQTNPRFVIGGTTFTTVTVNRWDATHDARTRVHVDDGDLAEGFGVISVLSSGRYTGGYLIFPRYRIAVDLRTTDVLLCDVHEWHANAPIDGKEGWERLSTIMYYRTKMRDCPR